MLPARILGTASLAPGRAHATDDLLARAMPGRDPARIKGKLGIDTRHWCAPGATSVAMGGQVLRQALADAGLAAPELRGCIYVSSVGAERIVPATANAVAAAAGTGPDCACFDLNNACTGWLTAFDLAVRLVQGHGGPVAVVAVEYISRYLRPENPRSYVVFGDAAAATIVGPGTGRGGMLASDFGNDARGLDATVLEVGQVHGEDAYVWFGNRSADIVEMAVSDLKTSVGRVLAAAGRDHFDWFLPHQPNGPMLAAFHDAVDGRGRTWPVVRTWGSLAACAIPVSLDHAWRQGPISDGETLLLASVGAGSSRGAVLFTVEGERG